MQVERGLAEVDEDLGAVFAFDTDEVFDAAGGCAEAGGVGDGTDAVDDGVDEPSTADLDGVGGPRVSFAEPADVSQVVDIHNFDAQKAASITTVGDGPLPASVSAPVKKVGLDDFQLVSVVGKGAYGKVFLVRKKPNPTPATSTAGANAKTELYAMKVLKKASIVLHASGKEAEHTRNERCILEEVQHPFIVTLHYAFQTPSKLYLILSYASGGELFTYLTKEKMFAEDVACFYISELLLALEHLHSLGIIYRDLKPENVLLSAQGHILLTDFGLSKVALDAQTVCGTIEFMAPEVLDEHRTQGYEKGVDYWSLGVMLFDMLTGAPPFTGANRKKIMDGILHRKVVWPRYMTAHARDLCHRLLQKNPAKRLGCDALGGVAGVKRHAFFRGIDWERLARLEVEPPIVPRLEGEEDTRCFDRVFTAMPVESPPPRGERERGEGGLELGLEVVDHFVGFSYVAGTKYL
ncbi:kinase-like domain-containing protein [Fimicolochytrium jonesii]|uniref:kinase-like domain-containing protein n=1 Tax=Fimicolochytrium jonesii TaxID=1396493 RepID=UPI0022FE380F|nr:kinase-like domain-containing protein [Fimicolochytrium jonesii]KAI8820721.1 kinase-like domain-containing protein [Fimicolochytrium jonesii]